MSAALRRDRKSRPLSPRTSARPLLVSSRQRPLRKLRGAGEGFVSVEMLVRPASKRQCPNATVLAILEGTIRDQIHGNKSRSPDGLGMPADAAWKSLIRRRPVNPRSLDGLRHVRQRPICDSVSPPPTLRRRSASASKWQPSLELRKTRQPLYILDEQQQDLHPGRRRSTRRAARGAVVAAGNTVIDRARYAAYSTERLGYRRRPRCRRRWAATSSPAAPSMNSRPP